MSRLRVQPQAKAPSVTLSLHGRAMVHSDLRVKFKPLSTARPDPAYMSPLLSCHYHSPQVRSVQSPPAPARVLSHFCLGLPPRAGPQGVAREPLSRGPRELYCLLFSPQHFFMMCCGPRWQSSVRCLPGGTRCPLGQCWGPAQWKIGQTRERTIKRTALLCRVRPSQGCWMASYLWRRCLGW